MRGAMLAKLKSGLLRTPSNNASSSSPRTTGKETHGSSAPDENLREMFDVPLDPNYMLQSQEQKQQLSRSASNNEAIMPKQTSPAMGRSPVLARRGFSASSQDSPRAKKTSATFLGVADTSGCNGESSLDSPNMSRARTMPSPTRGDQRTSSPAAPCASSTSDVRGNASADGSSVSVAFKKKQREMRTLPTVAPTDASVHVLRGAGPEDDYVDPFDAKHGNAFAPRSTAAQPSSPTGAQRKPADTYEDPFDIKRPGGSVVGDGSVVGGGNKTNGDARPPSDTYEDPFDAKHGNVYLPEDLYDRPLDALECPLPPSRSDESDYMDPFDKSRRPRSSPISNKRMLKARSSGIDGRLPPSSSETGNYSEPFDILRNITAHHPPPQMSSNTSAASQSSASNRKTSSTGSTHSTTTSSGPTRTISVPEVLIDTRLGNDSDEFDMAGGRRSAGMRDPSVDYVEPHDSVLRHQSRSAHSSGGVSPIQGRSPSSERPQSEHELSRPSSNNVSRSNSARSLRSDPETDAPVLLEDQLWYHGALRRDDAERRLAGTVDGCFIVRQSESCLTDYSLSLRNHKETMHLKIHRRSKDNRYVLGLHSMPFRSITDMISYYLKHNLPIRGAEHISLIKGVPRSVPVYANVKLL